MISVTMRRDDDVLQAIREQAIASPAKVRRFVGQQARGATAQSMIRELAAEPPRFMGKRDWQSPKQLRFVMAKLRREGNLPYRRTGRTRRAWRVVVENAASGALRVENKERAALFTQGDYQQRMHIKTGWPAAAPIIVRYELIFQDELIAFWYSITTRAGKQ
jgi:hypothetical protein